MSSNTRLGGKSRGPVDVAVVAAYCVLSVAWLIINPLRAQSEQDETAWYLRTHMCALDRQADCDE